MVSGESKSKSFLSKYVKSRSDNSSSHSEVNLDELSTYGINPLQESETSKKMRKMLDEAANEQTKIQLDG